MKVLIWSVAPKGSLLMKIIPIGAFLFFLFYFPLLLEQYSFPFPTPSAQERDLQQNNPYLDHLPPFAVLLSQSSFPKCLMRASLNLV